MTDRVSVVIPSRGRLSLRSAVNSAMRQTDVDVEIIVVDSSGDRCAEGYLQSRPEVRIIAPNRRLSAAEARGLGCREASGDWVAWLDDDDIFLPGKLETQVRVARNVDAAEVLVSSNFVEMSYQEVLALACASAEEFEELTASREVLPRVQPRTDEQTIRDYLFKRSRLRAVKRLVTSSFLVSGAVARSVQWPHSLRRFEDWAWLSALDRAGVSWRHINEPLVGISLAAPESLSAAPVELSPAHWAWPICSLDKARHVGDVLCADIGVHLVRQGDRAAALSAWRLARAAGAPGAAAQSRLAIELLRRNDRVPGARRRRKKQ